MSNDPFSNHATNGLNRPFDYDPYSSENYYDQPITSANITSLEDPDEFYRPFAERSSQPDIVIQTEDGLMAAPTRPRRASATGGASRLPSSSSATNSPARSTNRSVSGPAGPRTNVLNSAKSVPALSSSSSGRNGLIKERVKQLEKSRDNSPAEGSSRHNRTRTPSASNTSAGAVRSPPRTRLQKERAAASPRSHLDNKNNNRRPLFGEVLNTRAGADGAGYGIPAIVTDDESATGSMHKPNPMFSRNRSQSDIDASQSNSPTFDHHRSLSHDSGMPSSNGSSAAPSPTGSHSRNLSSSSRIPVRTRRASDIAAAKGTTRSRSRPAPPAQEQQNSQSPMLLTSRRYSPPKRLLDPNHSLTVMVKAPLPKTSPPLRSTRNRQPVNTATVASRSKVTERFKPVPNTSTSRPKPAIPQVDIAERRARLQKSLQGGAARAKPVRQDLKNLQDGKYQSHRTNWVDADAASDVSSETLGSRKSSTTFSVPILSIETADAGDDAYQDLDSAGASTKFEESPILGYGERQDLPIQATRAQSEVPNAEAGAQHDRSNSQSLLKHVLNMRQISPSETPRTEVPDDYFTQFDDGETIQILLGATPKMPSAKWTPEAEHSGSSPEAFHTPREESGSEFDDTYDGFDGRSSIVPDDSVSMVFQRKYADMLAREPPPPLPANAAEIARRHNNFTLNSDARSEINRVLDQYQDAHVTPEMAHGFQQQVESLTPNLSRHSAWESPEATKQYLRNVLGESTWTESPVDVQHDSKGKGPAKQVPVDESDEEGGGIAIIYRPTQGEELGEPLERSGTLHSHSTSNATLRPSKEDFDDDTHRSYLEDIAFRPAPPPKDFSDLSESDPARLTIIPTLPEFSSNASGLGLSMTHSEMGTAPPSPHPPVPVHAPPAPPTPHKDIASPGFPLQPALSPTTERRAPYDMFSPGLPASPAATRGRLQQTVMADALQQDAPRSAGASFDMSIASRNQSPFSIARSISDNRSSQSLVTPDVEKELTQRRHRVKELVDTEHTFHQDLTIMTDIYLATAGDVLQEEDRRTLFGNIEQLRSFTTDFLDALKRSAAPIYVIPRENRWNYKRGSFTTSNSEATENSASTGATIDERVENDRRTSIGQTFCEHLSQLQKVYSEWLRNATTANKRLVELQKMPAVKYWLDECIESHKDLTSAWNLDSLIVKPFQRSAKYTLLLDEILKYTHPDHPDHLHLKQAKDLVKAYNERANDVQKRTELVEQAMSKNKDPNGRIKVGKLLNRRTEKLKQQVGLSGQAEDPDYDAIAQKFGGHFFQLQVVMRDVEKYLDDVEQYVDQYVLFMDALTSNASTEALTRYPEMESRWVNFSKAIMEMKTYALGEHTSKVRKSVIDPIQQLWRLHVGPQKMMAKRKKRLVEYVRHKNVLEKGEKADKRLEQEAEQFRAVNETLKEELPKLYALTKKLVDNCLLNFIDLQAQWQSVWTRKLGPLIDDIEPLLEVDLAQALFSVQAAYAQDISEAEDLLATFKLCNKTLVTEARNLKSPATTYSRDDESFYKRPSTLGSGGGKRALSLSSEQAGHSTPNFRLSGDNMAHSPLVGSLGMPDGIYQTTSQYRTRAGSAMSSRGPSTPYSAHGYAGPSAYGFGRPNTSDRPEPSPGIPRLSLDSPTTRSPARNEFGNPYVLPDARLPMSAPADDRYSGMFHSALPMSDSPRAVSPELYQQDLHVLFLAASLFEFHIDSARKEGGYPYLTYQPGEIFDVVAQKGELWLAKNQDDATNTVGWIWEKHFARILPEN